MLDGQPDLFDAVASAATANRTIVVLAEGELVVEQLAAARLAARERAWSGGPPAVKYRSWRCMTYRWPPISPPLTTVRMPLEELGRRGIELISSLSAEAPIGEVITDPIELIVRGSTAPPG